MSTKLSAVLRANARRAEARKLWQRVHPGEHSLAASGACSCGSRHFTPDQITRY